MFLVWGEAGVLSFGLEVEDLIRAARKWKLRPSLLAIGLFGFRVCGFRTAYRGLFTDIGSNAYLFGVGDVGSSNEIHLERLP